MTINDKKVNPVTVVIAPAQWSAFEGLIGLNANEIDKADGLVDAQVIMDELHINRRTLANYISNGRITEDMYVESPVNGVKKFYYNKVMGIENLCKSK